MRRMLGKILFTIAVIFLVVLFWRTRRHASTAIVTAPRLVNPPRRWRGLLGWLAVAVVVVTLGGSLYLLFDHWRGRSEVIYVRVVDAGSGRSAEYRAERGEIGEREFTTVDGRHVILADTERLETSTIRMPAAGRN